jgi:hypothetical protein
MSSALYTLSGTTGETLHTLTESHLFENIHIDCYTESKHYRENDGTVRDSGFLAEHLCHGSGEEGTQDSTEKDHQTFCTAQRVEVIGIEDTKQLVLVIDIRLVVSPAVACPSSSLFEIQHEMSTDEAICQAQSSKLSMVGTELLLS